MVTVLSRVKREGGMSDVTLVKDGHRVTISVTDATADSSESLALYEIMADAHIRTMAQVGNIVAAEGFK